MAYVMVLKGTTPPSPSGAEEFVGPFDSWANVKTDYGAVGDGSTDDTSAIQDALDDLGVSIWTIYFPAGTYKITSTLTLAGQIYVNIVGEDPSTTSIAWYGAADGKMFYMNGVAYSRFDRFTWNGRSIAGICIDQSKADAPSDHFDTGNEYADNVFRDATLGIQGGYLGFGFAETVVKRCQFVNLTCGIAMGNFNALDLFVWYSRFQNCGTGVTNNFNGVGAGNYNVYHSVFINSTLFDVEIGNTGSFSYFNNYSSGSNIFLYASGTGNSATITLQGNTILDSTHTLGHAVAIYDQGPVFLIDNVIRSLEAKTTGPVVTVYNWAPCDIFSSGNTFTVTDPLSINGTPVHSINDQTVSFGSITAAEPTLPSTLPNLNRQVFEVAAGLNTAQIQAVIDAAAAENGNRPVVHFPPHTDFSITTSLTIPANNDLQIMGDGGSSRLIWAAGGTGPMFSVSGPSKATFADFYMNGNSVANGIVVSSCDQDGSRVFMEQPFLFNYIHNLFVNGLDYTNVQLHDFYHAGVSTETDGSVKVLGGTSAASGTWLGGKTTIFAGASGNSLLSYDVGSGGHCSARDLWFESATFSKFIHLTGDATFTFSGAKIAVAAGAGPMIDIVDFTGKATLLESTAHGNVVISGSGSGGEVLAVGLVGLLDNFFQDTTSPAATVLFLNGRSFETHPEDAATGQLAEVGSYNTTFITNMLAQIRADQPAAINALAAGVTDFRLYRVVIQSTLTGIQLNA